MIFHNESALVFLKNSITGLYADSKIGITSGCFDLLHPMHVRYLERCKRRCDVLIVGIDTDELIYQTKKKYPMFPENERAFMVESLSCVDHVFLMDELDTLTKVCSLATTGNVPELYKAYNSYYDKPVVNIPGVTTVFIRDLEVPSSTTGILEAAQALLVKR